MVIQESGGAVPEPSRDDPNNERGYLTLLAVFRTDTWAEDTAGASPPEACSCTTDSGAILCQAPFRPLPIRTPASARPAYVAREEASVRRDHEPRAASPPCRTTRRGRA